MKKAKLIISVLLLALSSLVYSMEPIETITTPRGHELHLVKASVKDGILTVYLMVENKSDERIEMHSLYVNQIQYIAGGRKYSVLKDEKNHWIASPMGSSELFYDVSNGNLRIKSGERVIGWMKFEAPDEASWPIEINIPRMLPFLIENPE